MHCKLSYRAQLYGSSYLQAAAKAKKVVDKEKKAREGLKKLEVSGFTCQGLSLLLQLCSLSDVR